jgi:hypothetical protein
MAKVIMDTYGVSCSAHRRWLSSTLYLVTLSIGEKFAWVIETLEAGGMTHQAASYKGDWPPEVFSTYIEAEDDAATWLGGL